jgi:hypothetical protein
MTRSSFHIYLVPTKGEQSMKATKIIALVVFTGVFLVLFWGLGLSMGQNELDSPSQPAAPQASTAFTYQGRLERPGGPITASCDMQFELYNAAQAGVQVGTTIAATVPVTQSLFTTALDFGSASFSGEDRWLELDVRCPPDSLYTTLPRQPLTPAPYALYAANADKLDNLESSNFARIARYGLPGGAPGSVDIPIPHYNAFQIVVGEAYGLPNDVVWLTGVENDFTVAWVAIDAQGNVTTGTASLGSVTTLLTITQGADTITLSTPGTGENKLVLTTSNLDVRAFIIY